VASEGAFGPHPQAFFLPGALEILALLDDELGLEITEQRLSTHTNFAHTTTASLDPTTERFLARVGFPQHALVVRADEPEGQKALTKGIRDRAALAAAISRFASASTNGLARIETDMRAHLNPARMAEIAILANQLATRLTILRLRPRAIRATRGEDLVAHSAGAVLTAPGGWRSLGRARRRADGRRSAARSRATPRVRRSLRRMR